MASKLEESLAAAVKEGRIPQAIVYATNKDSEKEGLYQTMSTVNG